MIDTQKIDRALEEISRYSKKVVRFLLEVCGPNGVVRKGGRGKEEGKGRRAELGKHLGWVAVWR